MEILRKTAANLIRSRERLRNTYTGQQTQGDKVQPIEVQSPDDKLMERIMRVIQRKPEQPEPYRGDDYHRGRHQPRALAP